MAKHLIIFNMSANKCKRVILTKLCLAANVEESDVFNQPLKPCEDQISPITVKALLMRAKHDRNSCCEIRLTLS